MPPYFFSIGHHPSTVGTSVVIAVLAIYVALDLAARVHRASDRTCARLWILSGSVAMGSGLWAMHFVGMSSAVYPFDAAYEPGPTALSWLAAVIVAGTMLASVGRATIDRLTLVATACIAGCGTTAMHYVGTSALVVDPAPVYEPRLIALAAATATLGAYVALCMFVRLRDKSDRERMQQQVFAALILGSALAAMHYIAMSSAQFAVGTLCVSDTGIKVNQWGTAVGLTSVMFLLLILLMTTASHREENRSLALNRSLAKVTDELRFVTFTDSGTGLPNRLVFQDRLKQAVAGCDLRSDSLELMLVEIDALKLLSESMSEYDIQALMREIAARLCAVVGPSDTVAAIGGEQFLVLLDRADDAVTVATRIADSFKQPIFAQGRPTALSASIGIARYPADGAWSKLIINAGTALSAVRQDGGNGYRFFEATMNAEAQAKSQWLDQLRLAVPQGQLELYYQPKVHALSGRITGVEALIRWRHPERGLISPAIFIPLAEQFGLINEIGCWVIAQACRQMQAWCDIGVRMRVAINISALQLRQRDLPDTIATALERHHVDPSLLTCEITESAAMHDTEATLAVFRRLAGLGIQISIDDFGTGYSSLSYLRKFAVSQLKVDRSFIDDVADSADARAVVAAIINLAHSLRLEVVAEGVETEHQRRVLLDLGCDKFQGFLFAKPMPELEFTAIVLDQGDRVATFRESLFVEP